MLSASVLTNDQVNALMAEPSSMTVAEPRNWNGNRKTRRWKRKGWRGRAWKCGPKGCGEIIICRGKPPVSGDPNPAPPMDPPVPDPVDPPVSDPVDPPLPPVSPPTVVKRAPKVIKNPIKLH